MGRCMGFPTSMGCPIGPRAPHTHPAEGGGHIPKAHLGEVPHDGQRHRPRGVKMAAATPPKAPLPDHHGQYGRRGHQQQPRRPRRVHGAVGGGDWGGIGVSGVSGVIWGPLMEHSMGLWVPLMGPPMGLWVLQQRCVPHRRIWALPLQRPLAAAQCGYESSSNAASPIGVYGPSRYSAPWRPLSVVTGPPAALRPP